MDDRASRWSESESEEGGKEDTGFEPADEGEREFDETREREPKEPKEPKVAGVTAKIDDPVRLYLTQMGEIPLLTREDELRLASRIEITRKRFRTKVLESPFGSSKRSGSLEDVKTATAFERTLRATAPSISEDGRSRAPACRQAPADRSARCFDKLGKRARARRGCGRAPPQENSAAASGCSGLNIRSRRSSR
jgi:hypothetical protein